MIPMICDIDIPESIYRNMMGLMQLSPNSGSAIPRESGDTVASKCCYHALPIKRWAHRNYGCEQFLTETSGMPSRADLKAASSVLSH